MTNCEKYFDKLKELANTNNGVQIAINRNTRKPLNCAQLKCSKCLLKSDCNFHCSEGFVKWLFEEYQEPKVKITKECKWVLEALNKEWKWIAKDKDGEVYVYQNKPFIDGNVWYGSKSRWLNSLFDDNLFNFLSWGDKEPMNIQELLENCEVIDDE